LQRLRDTGAAATFAVSPAPLHANVSDGSCGWRSGRRCRRRPWWSGPRRSPSGSWPRRSNSPFGPFPQTPFCSDLTDVPRRSVLPCSGILKIPCRSVERNRSWVRSARSSPSSIAKLLFQGLSYESHNVRKVFNRGKAHFNIAVSPATKAGDISGNAVRIIELGKLNVQRQQESFGLRNDVNEI
jgi:hypothetical protein